MIFITLSLINCDFLGFLLLNNIGLTIKEFTRLLLFDLFSNISLVYLKILFQFLINLSLHINQFFKKNRYNKLDIYRCSSIGVSHNIKIICSYLVSKLFPTLLQPHGLLPARLLCPRDFPGKRVLVWVAISLSRIFS